MTGLNVDQLVDQIERELPDADPVTRVGEARKQARALSDLGDQLIDHFIRQARAAGASWSQIGDAMGVSKQAAQQRAGSAAIFYRFTERARRVVAGAQEEARERRNSPIEPEHVLLALLEAKDALAANVIVMLGADPEAIAEAVRTDLPIGDEAPGEHIPFSPASKGLLQTTAATAEEMGHNYIGTEHILLALLRTPDTTAARALMAAGIDHQRARDTVAAALMGYQLRARGRAG